MNIINNNTAERDLPTSFGNNVNRLRNEQHLSYVQLANLVGVSPTYLCRIENGERRRVSYTIIKNLAQVFEVRITDLLGEDPVNRSEIKHGIFLEMKTIISESNLTHQEKIQQLKAVADICRYLLVS